MAKKSKKKKTVAKILSVILLMISIIFLVLTFMLNLIPIKYMLIILVVLVFVDLLAIKLLFSKLHINQVIGTIIMIVVSVISILGSIYEINTLDFFGNFGKYNYKTLNYNVLVLNNSKYTEIKELKNKTIAFAKGENVDKAIQTLQKEIKFSSKKLETTTELLNSLNTSKSNAIVLEESKYSIIKEDDDTLKDKFKILYTFSIDVKVKEIDKDVDVTEEAFNVYISGIDSYGKITSVARSDVNMVASVNPETNEILLTSIPRDYYVQLHDKVGYKDKLTHAGIYGIETSVQTVEDLLDIDINYYVKVNFTSLINVVDELDGIKVYSNYSFTSRDGYHYNKGYNDLNGKEALSFVRERKAFEGGDRVRGENQQAVLKAIIDKALSPKIITKYNSLLNTLEGSFVTNMDDSDLTSLVKKQLNDNAAWNISFVNLEGSDGYDYTYSHSASKLYVMIPDQDSVNQAKEKIQNVLN